ncbi:MAG: polysaccharide deacetylase [Lachnospiraceae bacterium]|nr:polysaccharide deacetylase [Lachnospiraceae bacterium]
MEGTYNRNKRILRLKRLIVVAFIAVIIVLTVVSVVLGVRVKQLKEKVKELEAVIAVSGERSDSDTGVYAMEAVEVSSRNTANAGQVQEDGSQNGGVKQIFLTFDDGPSSNTDRILDILKEYDVKATFFVVGKSGEQAVKAYQRIVAEGHTLAMHSYSHKYNEIYASRENFVEDLEKLQEYLYGITGIWPRIYRFPGGSSNAVSNVDIQELIDYLDENGIIYFDWNITAGDAENGNLSAERILENCVGNIDNVNRGMILMHDASNRNTTVEALPGIIERIQERGDAVILPVTDGTEPIHHYK